MMRLWTLSALVAFMLIAPSIAFAKGDPRLVGHWYGEGQQPYVQYARWIIEFRADETYRIVFRVYSGVNCELVDEHEESGVWQLDPRHLTMITTRVSGVATNAASADFRDTYRVARLDRHGYVIVHERYGMRFSTQRVGRRFSFPRISACPR